MGEILKHKNDKDHQRDRSGISPSFHVVHACKENDDINAMQSLDYDIC